jgi:cytochrome bd-type quinol oxidase subunit 2
MVIPIELVDLVPMSETRQKKISDGEKSLKMKRSLIERKELHFRCCRVTNVMCVIALFGVILMIIDTELRLDQISKTSDIIIRPLISISTVILIGLVICYHTLDIRLYAINNHIADWRVILTVRHLVMIICEVIICAIHPFPFIVKSSSLGDVLWIDMVLTLPSKSFFPASHCEDVFV